MEHDNHLIEQAASLMESLATGPPDDAVIAQLRDWLEKTTLRLVEAENQAKELHLLRSDVIARIGGMAKAVAIARGSESQIADAAAMIKSLEKSDVTELITEWRKMSARFRDTFRGSFGPISRSTSGGRSRNRNYSDFK